MKSIVTYGAVLSTAVLMACSTVEIPESLIDIDPDKLCQQVNEIVSLHQNDFADIKGTMMASGRMDVWQATTHLVGNDCQIWRWSNGSEVYVCSLLLPDEDMAIERFNKALDFSRRCLSDEWVEEKTEQLPSGAVRTIFSNTDNDTVGSINRIETEGLFKSEWMLYYFIGDRDLSRH